MNVSKIALLSAFVLAVAAPASAAEFTKGQVTKVDAKQQKVTVKHEELTNLDMPAMTMVFNVADEAMLEKVAEGSKIEFVADRLRGNMTIIELK
ncbi:copper-binding protein [Aurantimonas coralicida]|uniref:copper-binding protein n=1 Tax=Aurantimonas coralicida TaxID=182270 RepID=UPI001D192276|nr:copper-binding protein [Aurantimonas coralicida]MCC4299058.1 copper-binding protein [Aurantimonas coralicida]